MENIETENVKVPNAIIISGLSHTTADEEIFDYLKQYGSIARIIKTSESNSEFQNHVVVEFESGLAVEALEDVLPMDRQCTSDSSIVHHVELLAKVYSCEKGTGITRTFLSQLKSMARRSGKSFEHILKEELARITDFVEEEGLEDERHTVQDAGLSVSPCVDSPQANKIRKSDIVLEAEPHSQEPTYFARTAATASVGLSESPLNLKLSPDHFSPPEVQRVVVEHIVKSTDLTSQLHSSVKLRPFSGRVPCPNFEVDYETWKGSVEFYIADPTISSAQVVRKMVDSLLPPASSVVKSLGPHSTPRAYLDLLDSAYATVEDKDELFAKFLSINQNSGEKPSSYLHRLQTTLNKAVKTDAISAGEADRQLLKQFCRGCWNNNLITALHLEQKRDNPPTFAELLLLLRTEEDKQEAKANRMRQHLGFNKAKAQSHAHSVCFPDDDQDDLPAAVSSPPSAIKQIQKQIADLQAQIAALAQIKERKSDKNKTCKKKEGPKVESNWKKQPTVTATTTVNRPKPWYCFRCGEDGHIASGCSNPPNSALVDAKKKVLKEKQQSWEKDNKTDDTTPLN